MGKELRSPAPRFRTYGLDVGKTYLRDSHQNSTPRNYQVESSSRLPFRLYGINVIPFSLKLRTRLNHLPQIKS